MKRRQKGFSLLEAVVAITLLAISGGALFAWVNTMLISLERVEANAAKILVVQQSLAVLEVVNPMKTPVGGQSLGEYDLTWRSVLVEDIKDSVSRYGIRGLYQVGLFDVVVEIHKDRKAFARFRVRQIGYQQVRESEG